MTAFGTFSRALHRLLSTDLSRNGSLSIVRDGGAEAQCRDAEPYDGESNNQTTNDNIIRPVRRGVPGVTRVPRARLFSCDHSGRADP